MGLEFFCSFLSYMHRISIVYASYMYGKRPLWDEGASFACVGKVK